MDVGFYMSNTAGRLLGTLLSDFNYRPPLCRGAAAGMATLR